eukprot:m.735856 g.735856  ORF g.735856 m.735856 type:complete len:79 (-) comp58893_c0_seq32:105-341(-)
MLTLWKVTHEMLRASDWVHVLPDKLRLVPDVPQPGNVFVPVPEVEREFVHCALCAVPGSAGLPSFCRRTCPPRTRSMK